MIEQVRLNREERLLRIAALKIAGAGHLVPLVRALEKGVDWIQLLPDKTGFTIPRRRRTAWLAVIGDDLTIAEGPTGFHLRSLRELMGRARAVFIMAGAPVQTAYAAAADLAEAGLNTVIIETQTSEEESWGGYVKRHAPKRAMKTLITPNAAAYDARRRAA